MKKKMINAIMLLALTGGSVMGANVVVNTDITTDTTWTANNIYSLEDKVVYVKPGASLTIEAGTQIRSKTGAGGSLAVCRGAKIYVNGTAAAPVVMTSTNDNGTWRPVCNEWGNLTIMGNGVIGRNGVAGSAYADADTAVAGYQAVMEGLVADPATATSDMKYGGTNDNDDSGSISYLSLRYGGKVVTLTNELNGLSLGGIGGETDIHHVEIMNNVDDGIEIWGGTVDLKYVSIWNIGDDSFDVDQGWRGNAQFGLIVQGYSANAGQGSGVGDNCFEVDGAEDGDSPVLTDSTIANFTVVGQKKGDGATVWRTNANVRYLNCIFMDIGEEIVRLDYIDGDGDHGYGYNGTDGWDARWADGRCAIKGCLMYNNTIDNQDNADKTVSPELKVGGVTTYPWGSFASRDIYAAANSNIQATVSPIKSLIKAAKVSTTGGDMYPVTYIDPRAQNNALTAGVALPSDPFFDATANFRGGFNANTNWIDGWTAAAQFGLTGSATQGDLTGDGNVDMNDFSELAENWLN